MRRRRPSSRGLDRAAVVLAMAVLVAAPVLAGGVHRGVMIGLMWAELLALVLLCTSLKLGHRPLRADQTVALPLVLLAIPLLQSIPLPYGLRGVLDSAGNSLLVDNALTVGRSWPLSLDPPATRIVAGRAAAALASFLIAYHLGAGQSRRHLVLRCVALTGVGAVFIGLGHRVVGAEKLYGQFAAPMRSLLVGPFVNRNHTAELLELSAFVCLACAWQRPTLLNRIGWLSGTLLCAAGALATLSRGSVLALLAGASVVAVLWFLTQQREQRPSRRMTVMWIGGLLVVLAVVILAVGADELVSRFRTDAVGTDVRFKVWRDGLRVLAAHPFGIGRGAFDRVFPVYRTVKMPFPVRFAFLENEPLQFLVDCGWFFTSLILLAGGVLLYSIARYGRRDRIEIALCAALVAVLAHGLVDFGLETMGVLLPFSAVAGSLFGRTASDAPNTGRWARAGWATAGIAAAGLIFGAVATAHRSADKFDALLEHARTPAERKAILARAEQTEPVDYLYALERARLEPLAGSPSPRLHALNRALRLCPSCDVVHIEVARNLWRIGSRRQALLEWRSAVELQPQILRPLMTQLYSEGATPEELVSLGVPNPERMLQIVDFLRDRGRTAEAFAALNQAQAFGGSAGLIELTRASLLVETGQLEAAQQALQTAEQAGVDRPDFAILKAQLLIKLKADAGVDEALAILDRAAARYPRDLPVQRERLDLIRRYKRWKSAASAIEAFKAASYQTLGSATNAHVVAAEIDVELGRVVDAMSEYRIALSDRPSDVQLWLGLGRTAEMAGQDLTAREAYEQAGRLAPRSPDVARAQKDLDERQARLRALLSDPPGRGP